MKLMLVTHHVKGLFVLRVDLLCITNLFTLQILEKLYKGINVCVFLFAFITDKAHSEKDLINP